MKRYLFIGSVDYSAECLKALLEMKINLASIMCPRKEVCALNADYVDLGRIAKKHKKDAHYFNRIADEAEYIRKEAPDVILVLGLPQIIPEEILNIPAVGCMGSHPAMLPENRGRHPIVWALAKGLKKSGVSLFWMDKGVDSGDIWAQREFEISFEDDARAVYDRVTGITIDMLKEKIPELERGEVTRFPQDNSRANYWRKRKTEDGFIDWGTGSEKIYNLVRALTKPYVGAHSIVDNRKIRVWKTRILGDDSKFSRMLPGEAVTASGGRIRVKTGDGLIELVEFEFEGPPKEESFL